MKFHPLVSVSNLNGFGIVGANTNLTVDGVTLGGAAVVNNINTSGGRAVSIETQTSNDDTVMASAGGTGISITDLGSGATTITNNNTITTSGSSVEGVRTFNDGSGVVTITTVTGNTTRFGTTRSVTNAPLRVMVLLISTSMAAPPTRMPVIYDSFKFQSGMIGTGRFSTHPTFLTEAHHLW